MNKCISKATSVDIKPFRSLQHWEEAGRILMNGEGLVERKVDGLMDSGWDLCCLNEK